MKINIGSYRSDIIPVNSWEKRYEYWRKPDTCFLAQNEYTWYDKLILGALDKLSDFVRPLNRWSNSRERRVKVHIDYYDVWSADHTLGMIIHPVLVKLKETKHGYPHVNMNDLPTVCLKDASAEEQWEWVLDEMIWAFGQHGLEDDSAQYYHNSDQLEMISTPTDDTKELYSIGFNHQKDPTKPPYWRDDEGLKKHAERKENGRRLFAKYYEALWDS